MIARILLQREKIITLSIGLLGLYVGSATRQMKEQFPGSNGQWHETYGNGLTGSKLQSFYNHVAYLRTAEKLFPFSVAVLLRNVTLRDQQTHPRHIND